MSETKNDTEARAKREIADEYWYVFTYDARKVYDALVAERVKNLELQEENAELQEELDGWKGLL